MAVFWHNTLPYLLLMATSISALVVALLKSSERRFLIAFTAAALGLVFYIESLVVIVLNAYAYHPALTSDAFQDTVFGNLFSQFSIVTTAALLIMYRLSVKWYLVAAVVYYLIDVLFLSMEIYEHIWYRSVYTLVGFVPLLLLLKLWYQKLIAHGTKLLYCTALLLGTSAVLSVFLVMPLKLTGLQVFTVPFFSDGSKNHTTSNLLYSLIMGSVMITLVEAAKRTAAKTVLFAAMFIFKYMLLCMGLLAVAPGWFVLLTVLELAGRYGLTVLYGRFLRLKPSASKSA